MGIESFFTLQSLLPGAQNSGTGKAASAPVQIQGLGFIDMILSRLLETAQVQTTITATETTPLQSENPLLDKQPGLNIAELLAATPGVEKEVKDFITAPGTCLTPEQQLVQTLQLNQQAFDQALAPLTDGVITLENVQKGSPRILQALLIDTDKDKKGVLNTLSLILDKLEKLTQDKTGAGLALINLTPEQITQLKAKIESLLANAKPVQLANNGLPVVPAENEDPEKDKDDIEIAAIVLGLIKLLPPQAQPEVIIMPRGLVITPRQLETVSLPDAAKPANDLTGKLNSLVTGTDAPAQPATGNKENFEDLLKQFSGKKDSPEIEIAKDVAKVGQPTVKADLSVLQNWPFPSDGSLLSQPLDSAPLGFSLTGPASLTNPLTQAQQASMPMPAVQLVATTLQKAVGDGLNKNFTLQLEPPELGRIEVRLSFGKDKAVKAIVVAERSETVAMLSRDAHVLERALTSAGLDADGSLSFELANDGHFGQDGGHDGSNSGNNGAAADDEEIISTMTWYVDPATGHTRYDMFV